MARPKKEVVDTPAESLDDFIARVLVQNSEPITAAEYPDTACDYQAETCGFKVTPGKARARLSDGRWVE